jgi:hypothetical protein
VSRDSTRFPQRNRFGLSRDVPADTRRRVRQQCGFGCVLCGHPICQYEHIDPEFADARSHDAGKMALLCGTCHDKVTRGLTSKDKVKRARDNPCTFSRGLVRDAFDFASPFQLRIGTNTVQDVRSIIRSRKDAFEWFRIDPAEDETGPPMVTARFFDANDQLSLEIVENEWRCKTSVWDLEIDGQVLRVRNGHRNIHLQVKALPPHGFEIQRLHMAYRGSRVSVLPDGRMILCIAGVEFTWSHSLVISGDTVFSIP